MFAFFLKPFFFSQFKKERRAENKLFLHIVKAETLPYNITKMSDAMERKAAKEAYLQALQSQRQTATAKAGSNWI